MSTHELTEDELNDDIDDDPPCVRAARNPDPAVISAILRHHSQLNSQIPDDMIPARRSSMLRGFSANTYISGAIHGYYTSPLVEAIRASLPGNIEILLQAGADPNGIPLDYLDEYSVRFIRGRDSKYDTYSFVACPPRSKVLAISSVVKPQISPLTQTEILRRRKGFSRFWTEPAFPTISFKSKPARTALEEAASKGDIAIFDQVRASNPDESWWTSGRIPSQLPDILTHSSLSVSSPIHEAIISTKNEMLEHLLAIGYSPNILPLAAPTCCIPPHIAAIGLCRPPNQVAYDILASDPHTDLALRTPIYSVHVLHFAAALLDISLLQRLCRHTATPLSSAGCTALGHTLLHVASLPLTDLHVNIFSQKVFESVHDVRTLDTKIWVPMDLHRRNPANRGILTSKNDNVPLPRTRSAEDKLDETRQHELILWLLDSGTQNLAAEDVYGNTIMHYLASAASVNVQLLNELRAMEGGENVWKERKNMMGHSPEELFQDGLGAEVEQWKDFWMS
ncbi:hypothetical protein JR316_0008968 [Psilocybe cubensis]|uniref:Ankyrin n=2 Tax=Psilocybe cubensis TaxID=181762 RepID=A0A8H7XY94_PSICU|nr:hypothetical protein JR316_0008968 [Psilocybe cubensis]KAH9478513.1 hypothetical protein JR316_0008968 [Psilocybe cubensis]